MVVMLSVEWSYIPIYLGQSKLMPVILIKLPIVIPLSSGLDNEL